MRQLLESGQGEIRWICDRSFRREDGARNIHPSEREMAKEACYRTIPDAPKVINTIDEITVDDHVDVIIEATGSDVIDMLKLKRRLWGDGTVFVTANKAMVSRHLDEFFGAGASDVRIEAAVAAGLPLIRSLAEHISADRVQGLVGILNGTTNFILDLMENHGASADDALEEAIRQGYAEPGGVGDIDGQDAAFKLQILARMAYQIDTDFGGLNAAGLIRGIDANLKSDRFDQVRGIDFAYARRLGYTIRLVAMAEPDTAGSSVRLVVHPMLVPLGTSIARVRGPDNYVEIYSRHLGYTDMQGQGAGPEPTACALLADAFNHLPRPLVSSVTKAGMTISDPSAIGFGRWMVRASCHDHAGVLGYLFEHLQHHGIGIDEVYQLGGSDPERLAWERETGLSEVTPFAFTTTHASLRALREVLRDIPLNAVNNKGQSLFPAPSGIFAVFPLIESRMDERGVTRLGAADVEETTPDWERLLPKATGTN